MTERPEDPYLDPAFGILRNKLGITDPVLLNRAETDFVEARSLQFTEQGRTVRPDLTGLCLIHKALFDDVYDWAGELRTVDIRKNVGGAVPFIPASRIVSGAGYAFAELAADRCLRGLPRVRFVERLAHHYDQVNYVHPFREGNGRTQRLFWTGVAIDAGWSIGWAGVTGAANDDACRHATESGSTSALIEMFDAIVTPHT